MEGLSIMTNNTSKKALLICIAGLLSAIGIMIPMVAPSIRIEPASFTLASHVAVFIAMFISPTMAISVALISSIGFFIGGFPFVIVLRALTHLIFAFVGAMLLKKNNNILLSFKTLVPFALFLSVLHSIAEVAVVSLYYFGTGKSTSTYYLIGLVGVGTIIHSLVDFSIATVVWIPLQHVLSIPANARVRRTSKVSVR
jgi:niacin transporter